MWPLHHHRQESRDISNSSAAPALLAILADPSDRDLVRQFTDRNQWGLNVVAAVEHAAVSTWIEVSPVILLDRDLAGQDWRSTVRMLAAHTPAPSVILASPVLDSYLFSEVVHHGGYDVISKPLQLDELRRMLGLAFSFWKNQASKTSS
jgi:DNA-binding NtrC family response regulator